MKKYVLDTNIVLRFINPADRQHHLVTEAVAIILANGHECYLLPQILIEFWVVATRPIDVNGLGWSAEYTRRMIDQLLERFPMAEEYPQIFSRWLALVTANQINGKRTHDARIAAAMLASDIHHILTLNPKDFTGISDIRVTHPQEILSSK
ncbi:MAG: type II toxin-antitoxin system VapC family toxin [Chloroflexota bacterium]